MKTLPTSYTRSLLILGLGAVATLAVSDQVPVHKDHSHSDENTTIASELKVGAVDGIGSYKLRIDQYGEPAPMPLRLSVQIDCGNARPFVAFNDVVACGGGTLKIEKKDLVLSFLKPDQKEKCARAATQKIALAAICK
jgi:hypothetical protein